MYLLTEGETKLGGGKMKVYFKIHGFVNKEDGQYHVMAQTYNGAIRSCNKLIAKIDLGTNNVEYIDNGAETNQDVQLFINNTIIMNELVVKKFRKAILISSNGTSISWCSFPTVEEAKAELRKQVGELTTKTSEELEYSWITEESAYLCPLDTNIQDDTTWEIIHISDV